MDLASRRSGYYRKPRHQAHPLDCSVMTYRGHHVLSTLIRCHFSPVESTGGQYVYTGGSNGVIWIYHLDGRVVQGESRCPSDTKQHTKREKEYDRSC